MTSSWPGAPRDDKLDLVVVDVSGKGVEAGSRSLFLSGAFNGIVSALPGDQFLPAANDYLLGQNWGEGFATAIHLHLDLPTGDFELRKAGHPPAVWLHAGSGRWSVLNSDGPVLGLLEDAEFDAHRGPPRAGRRAAAVHRRPGRDRPARHLAGHRQARRARGAARPAAASTAARKLLIDSMEQTNDDRALVLVHRRSGARAILTPVRDRGVRCGTMVPALAGDGRGACADVAQW